METPHTSALKKLKLLISLAQIDGAIAEQETQYIINIGKSNGLQAAEIEPLFDRVHALVLPSDLSEDDRFNYLLSMVQLMKADEKMFREELLFCKKMAENLGYDSQVLFDMLLHVKSIEMTAEEQLALKKEISKYLK
ncbi:hypothetical protein WBG78_21195 [Chryseolinea sp. T2]|uniref:hypothetical protein n=1 Tax=Chryseolinea sp. T2 TaxID=3129255 RepID=UPI003076903F